MTRARLIKFCKFKGQPWPLKSMEIKSLQGFGRPLRFEYCSTNKCHKIWVFCKTFPSTRTPFRDIKYISVNLNYYGLHNFAQTTKLCVSYGSGWIIGSGQNEFNLRQGTSCHICSVKRFQPGLRPPQPQPHVEHLSCCLARLCLQCYLQLSWWNLSLLGQSFFAFVPLPQTFETKPPCRPRAWEKIQEINKSFDVSNIIPNLCQETFTWERSLSAPVEGVNWVRPSKHGKPRGDKELEIGWPRYSGWHSLASFGITANVKVFNCLVFTLFWLQLMLLLFSLLFNSIKCLSFFVDRIEVGFTYLRKKWWY